MRTRKIVRKFAVTNRDDRFPSYKKRNKWYLLSKMAGSDHPTNRQIKDYLHTQRGDSYKVKL